MPYLWIQTNKVVDEQTRQGFLRKASQLVARELQKPEKYMMVRVEQGQPMMFAGSTGPAAFLQLKAIGLPEAKTGELTRLLCALVQAELGISQDRVYINFTDVAPNLWGWNGETF
jgi:phenylpyruvate tautomerase PptA (4-oxalocrotonate tautomerase family)